MLDIACVGIIVADVIAKPIDILPGKGLLGQVDSVCLFNGGNAMTAAVNTSKLGLKSAIIGKIGNDAFGEFIKGVLNLSNVNIEGLAVDENIQTSASVALSSSDGERTFLHCVGANGTFSIDDVNWEIIEKSKIIFVTGSFLLDTFDGEQTRDFLGICKKMRKITAVDVCWDSKGRWGELLFPAMPYIDIFLPSIDEAREIAKTNNLDEMSSLFMRQGVKKVIIKLGKNGCYVRESIDAAGVTLAPCGKNIMVVDTTGAGDSFCSGFLTEYAKGASLLDCAKFANAAGAISVTAQGSTSGIKSYNQVLNFMKNNS